MQLNLSVSKTTKGGIKPLQTKSHKTTINNTIFNIVTKGLYIRPIDAIVREICTNALDGHIVKGNPEQPFEITLPTSISPYFTVRDFGCSMDNDTVFDVYAVLGESTKNATSDSIGGWGVGGKSPAAYTDTFFITTYKDGIRRLYQSSCLADCTPLELLLQGKTDEPDGVLVKIPIKKVDYYKFIDAVKSQLSPFEVKPIITNLGHFFEEVKYNFDLSTADKIEISPTILLPENSGELAKQTITTNVYTECTKHGLSIRMGCVVYPINVVSDFYIENEEKILNIKKLSGIDSFILDLPVDSVDIKPSREDLDYTERTNDVLVQLINSLTKHYKKEIISIAFAARNLSTLEAANYIQKNASHENVIKYLIKNYKTTPYFGSEKIFYRNVPDNFSIAIREELRVLERDTFVPNDFTTTDGDESKKLSKSEINFHFNPDMNLNIILKCTGFIKKIRYALDQNLLPESGLYLRRDILRYSFSSNTEIKEGLFFGKKSLKKQLVLTQEQIDTYKPVFEKFYKNVTIHELPEIPKEVKSTYASEVSSYCSEMYLSTFNEKGNVGTEIVYKSYSFKSVQEIKNFYAGYSVPVYFFVAVKKEIIEKPKLFRELSKLLNINIVCLKVPEAFSLKVLNKTSLGFYEESGLEKLLLNNVPKIKIEEIKKEYLDSEFNDNFFDLSYKESNFSKFCLNPFFFKYLHKQFFKFVPEFNKKECQYPTLINVFLTEQEIKQSKKLATTYKNRAIKRLDLISKHKPTTKLLDINSEPELGLKLFKLNFKDFTYE
jgi:hypothetical protein